MAKIKFFQIFITIVSVISILNNENTPLKSELQKSYGPINFKENEEITEIVAFISKFSNNNRISENKFLEIEKKINKNKETSFCNACIYTFNNLHTFLLKKYGKSGIDTFFAILCSTFSSLNKNICKFYINSYGDHLYDSLVNHYLSAEYVCTRTEICTNTEFIKLNPDDYARKLIQDKPRDKKIPPIDTKATTWKMVHIADIHIDTLYKEGTSGICDLPVCCRDGYAPLPKNEENTAGKWGYLGPCDIPFRTLESFANYTKEVVQPDFIIWTGDNPAHDIWLTTQEDIVKITSKITDLFLDKFNNTIVYPSVGNHEAYPNDLFSPFIEESLFKKLGDLFKNWLDQQAYETFSKYGYYSQLHPGSNLRIISTNCLLCDLINFDLIRNAKDPYKQIEWLENTLRQAEMNNEVVYIISHIAIGDESFSDECSKRFQALLDRFSFIIRGVFFGHTHFDEIKVSHEYFNHGNISSVSFIAPSLTTYGSINPSFRVFDIDSHTKLPKDYLQFQLNLTLSNREEKAIWENTYRASEHFEVNFLNETNKLYDFAMDIETDEHIFEKALKAFYANSPQYSQYLHLKSMSIYL